ncbi:hypothetical protein JTB14_027376 [Gonioctena quinquepunctata]|nr:hypothetical protein JTB14_027376 [Gonioctena quinquepunctata]
MVLTKFAIVSEREMEQTEKHRSVLRSTFTKKADEKDQLITAKVMDIQHIQHLKGSDSVRMILLRMIVTKKKSQPIATLSTTAGLINCDVANCVCCWGIHDSEGCFKAQKLSSDQKKNTLSEKKACFRCLKTGHMSRRCRSRLKCVICRESHETYMWADLPSNKIISAGQFSGIRDKECTKTENQVLTNHTSTHVFLQTLHVEISSRDRSPEVRVLIDSDLQRSYVLKSTVLQMG